MDNIRKWILDFYDKDDKYLSYESCLFIVGNSGIGKTYNIYNLCNELDLFIIDLDTNICISSLLFNDFIVKSLTTSLIQQLTNNNRKKIIIIDDFDILLSNDSVINITLYNILGTLNKYKNIPIICISSNELIKKIGNIKKKCKIIECNDLTNEEIINILKKNEKYKLLSDNYLNNIINKNNNNINQCIKELENNNINYSIDKKYNNLYIYSGDFNRDIYLKIILKDQWLIPLNYHENLINLLNNKKCNINIKNLLYKKFIYNFCYFNSLMIENNIDIAIDFFISFIYDINKLPNKKTKNNEINNFTKILSYLSLQKKNLKISYNNNFPIYQIGNYHISIINRKFIYYN